MKRLSRSWAAVSVGFAFIAVACNDETTSPANGNFDDFSSADQAALVNAIQLVQPLVENGLAGFAELVVDQLDFVGATDGFDAIGMEIVFDVTTDEAQFVGVSGSIFGWSGLSSSSNTLSAVVTAGGVILNAQSFTGSVPVGDTGSETQFGFGGYYDSATMSNYEAASGAFTVSSSSFGGTAVDCTRTTNGTTVSCSAVPGQMSGSFSFVADLVSGTGSASYSQSNTSFSLPAVRMTITVEP